MSKSMNRRCAIQTGIITTGAIAGTSFAEKIAGNSVSSGVEPRFSERSWWTPGANPNYVRNLRPGPTPIRLACMSPETMMQYPKNESITDVVKRIREKGYTATNAHYSIGTRNAWLDASDTEIRELKTALKEYDVDFYDIMVWTNLLHPDSATRQKNIKYVCETFEAADRCGVRSITGITGSRGTGFYTEFHPDNWTKETWALTVSVMKQILRDTSGCKTAWGMEQCITTNIDGPLPTKQLMEDVADPRFKVVLDPTNMMNLERYFRFAEVVDETFDLLGENIVGCHAKDYTLGTRMLIDLQEVPPGKGVQDYEILLAHLSRLSWSRTLMMEHFPAKEYPSSKEFLLNTAAKIGVKIYS